MKDSDPGYDQGASFPRIGCLIVHWTLFTLIGLHVLALWVLEALGVREWAAGSFPPRIAVWLATGIFAAWLIVLCKRWVRSASGRKEHPQGK